MKPAEARIKAAAEAAAKAFAGKAKTVFYDVRGSTGPASSGVASSLQLRLASEALVVTPFALHAGTGLKTPVSPAPDPSSSMTDQSKTAANPLAAILGYE